MSEGAGGRTAKARSLGELARLVAVPPFVIVPRGGVLAEPVAERLIVRGCALDEDGSEASAAGRSPTVGPVPVAAVDEALATVFADPRVHECIVQAWQPGPSGVALGLDDGSWLVEYARPPGGVTAGRLSPYCALLPNALPRYAALQRQLAAIGEQSGAADVEFVGLDQPVFVQRRPLTAPVSCDRELVRVKQHVQELEAVRWRQDAFCTDLMERPEQDAAWLELFLDTVGATFERLTGRRPALPARPFLKVGRQLFCDARFSEALRIGGWQAFRVGLGHAGLTRRVEALLADPSTEARALMQAAMELNLHGEVFGARRPQRARKLFELRERCRRRLADVLPRRALPVDVEAPRRLAPELDRDAERLAWTRAAWASGRGLEIVAGAPRDAPVHRYDRRPERVPPGVLLHTEELYPELADVLGRVAGVVCAGGGVGSHLAILCRERAVPLRIQVAG